MNSTNEKCSGYGMYYWDWDNYLKQDKETHPSHLPDINGPSGWYYDYPPYCYNDNPSWRSVSTVHEGKKPYEMFTNESDLNYHKQRTRYYVARYGYSTKIFEFEMLSEPWSLNSAEWAKPYDGITHPEHLATRNAVKNYHEVISEYLKDSLKVNQLVGIDIHYWPDSTVQQLEGSIALSKIDIVGTNPYYADPSAAFSFYDYLQKIHQKHGSTIPVILAEGRDDEEYQRCSGYSQHPVDMMTFPFTGVAGYFTWFGMQEGLEYLWPATIRAQQHMDGEQVIETLSEGNGQWVHDKKDSQLKKGFLGLGRTKNSLVEQQYYTSASKNSAVGYVKNRTYNVHTKGCSSMIFDNDDEGDFIQVKDIQTNNLKEENQFTIGGLLSKTKYYVDWYSYKEGNYLKTDYLETNSGGDLKLEFPTLYTEGAENPVAWFVAHKNAYSGMMQYEDTLKNIMTSFEFQPVVRDTVDVNFTNSIFPNPFNNVITVNSIEDDYLILTIPSGAIVKEVKIQKGINCLILENLPKGLYFAEFKNQEFITKIIRL